MKKSFIILISALPFLYACVSEIQESETVADELGQALSTKLTGNTTGEHMEGCLLVFLDEAAATMAEESDLKTIAEGLFGGRKIEGFGPALRHMPKNEAAAKRLGLHRWYAVSFDKSIPVRRFAAEIAGHPGIRRIQFNNMPRLASDCESRPFRLQTKSGAEEAEAIPFNDPLNGYQWNLVNTGDKAVAETVREGADVGVRDAWKLTGGTPDVIVAICDAPVKYTHPDLTGAMWVNEAEKNGEVGKDDDGNGYIDDVHGYNFYPSDQSHGKITWERDGETGHGTHVAGIVAAVNGNGIGISSIAGGTGKEDGVRIMSCQIFEGGRAGGDREMAEALMYAADNGACIAQCSYGYSAYLFQSDNSYSTNAPLEYSALKYFLDPENSNHPSLKSNIAIYAAGNEAASSSDYPGALPICVSVTAFGPDYLPTGYTNYGRGCNIAAPGGDSSIGASIEEDNISRILSTCISEVAGEYAWMEGSSMACPHVSGVAALGVSYAGKLGKVFTGKEFVAMLLTSVNDINQYLEEGLKPYGNYNLNLKTYHNRMGTGAVDAWKLLMQIEGTPSAMVQTGKTSRIDMREYFGESADDLTYTGVEFTDEARKALGLASTPKVKEGMMEIICTKNGSAKITVSAIAGGKEASNGDNIGGMVISKEISIVSRGIHSDNGGWL